MAEKILNTRILMKADTLENWEKSTLPLKKGELAIATVAATAGTGLAEPVCMIKIGEDGVKTFKDLSWNMYAKASDVLAACKNEDALKTFVNGVIADAGIASSDAMEALAGRVTTAEGKITTLEGTVGNAEDGLVKDVAVNASAITVLEGLVGETAVAEQISTAIANEKLAETYAAKVHKHEIADVNGLADAIADAKAAGTAASTALGEYKTTNDESVKANADAIDAVEATIGTVTEGKTVVEMIADAKTEATYDDTALAGRVTVNEGAIATLNGEGAGSVKKAVDDALNDFATKVSNDGVVNTYKELVDYAAANGSDMATLTGKVSALETTVGKAAEGETAATGLVKDVADLETKVGDKTVAEQITAAVNPVTERVIALEAVDHEHANKTVLDGIEETDVTAWDAKVDDVTAAADSGLKATRTGNTVAVEIDDSITWVFDCGNSGVVAE